MTDVTVTLSGDAHRRIEDDNGTTRYEECELKHTETFSDPQAFDDFACKSASSMATISLSDQYALETRTWDSWDVTVDFNAIEARNWAEAVADEDDTRSVVDVLSYWLQVFGSMRIRRALHSVLEDHGVEVSHVG